MKKILFSILLLVVTTANAQFGDTCTFTLPDQIRKNFNYDSLPFLSCESVPPGLYGIQFHVDKKGRCSNFQATNDSLPVLNNLLMDAIKKSEGAIVSTKLKKGNYIQLIFYSNLSCNPFIIRWGITSDTLGSTVNMENLYKEMSHILNNHIISIEHSVIMLQVLNLHKKKMIYLPITFINNENPSFVQKVPSFKNDTNYKSYTKEDIEIMEKQVIEKQKKNKQR